jgi:arylsulfatase A-like enzyme
MNRLSFVFLNVLMLTFVFSCKGQTEKSKKQHPNIIILLADDMGQGDLSCYNPDSKIHTPNIDRLASQGAMFTDAHTGASVCTPTRYGIMTGRYSWRSKLKSRVLTGYDRSMIPANRQTIASMMKNGGYNTALIGKWHMGLDWTCKEGEKIEGFHNDIPESEAKIDFTKPIKLGPANFGFDYWYGIPASWDFPPYIFIENDMLTEQPTRKAGGWVGDIYPGYTKESIVKHKKEVPVAIWRPGIAGSFKPQDAISVVKSRTVDYIKNYNEEKPLFLYVSFTAPHTPIVPGDKFRGKSQCGIYGDFCVELDDAVGTIIDAIKEKGLFDNSIIIYTADNGTSVKGLPVGYQKKYHHSPSYIYKGYKGRLDEGGHRVPFIAAWPGHIQKGSVNESLICLNDLFATFAEITEQQIPDNTAEDSNSFLAALNGKTLNNKERVVIHSDFGGFFGIRKGDWKLTLPRDPKKRALYNLKNDPGEKHNLITEYPEKATELTTLLGKVVKEGRSTPGKTQKNEGPETWEQLYWLK